MYEAALCGLHTLQKHAYSNILKISPPNTESFQTKILIFFHTCISAQNINCGNSLELPRRGGSNEWRGGSNEYSQSMSLSRNKKNNVYFSFTI